MANTDNKPAFVKRDTIIAGKEYAGLLSSLKERFRKSQIKAAIKVNTFMLEYYWYMGRDISRLHEAAKWGSAFFDCLSLDLKAAFPGQTGFSVTNIKYAKRWYEFYNQDDTIRQQVVDELEMPADFAGKLNFYVSAVDELMKQPDDNPTIGLLICKSKDDTVVEWSFRGMNQPLGIAEYQLKEFISEKAAKLLPSESELQNIIDTYDVASDD